MKSAGLVLTTRGAAGGYQLAKPPREITLADIFGVLDRMDEPEKRSKSPSAMGRSLQRSWKGLAETMSGYLAQIKLADLLPTAAEFDYVI
jgi:Rrf2 family protein